MFNKCYFLLVSVVAMVCCTDGSTSAVPPTLCRSADVVPVCDTLIGLRLCTNITIHNREWDNSSFVTDVDTYLARLATNCTAGYGVAAQVLVMSRQVVTTLTGRVHQSNTIIARAIAELAEQLDWNRITIITDFSDSFFLGTAEELYNLATSTSDFNLLQIDDSASRIENVVSKIERLNLRIVVLSLRTSLVYKLLHKAQEHNLMWPEYAWIIHSVDVNTGSGLSLEGVIFLHYGEPALVHMNNTLHIKSTPDHPYGVNVYRLESCHISDEVNAPDVSISQYIGRSEMLVSQFSGMNSSLGPVKIKGPIPSDLPPQYSPTLYIVLFYAGSCISFLIVTGNLILYFHFRSEPEIKATSVSLSILIFIGCYLPIIYSLGLTSSLLPSYHKKSSQFRNFICLFRVWLHGLVVPLAIIFSTLLIKLLRVYRIFNRFDKIKKKSSNCAWLCMF